MSSPSPISHCKSNMTGVNFCLVVAVVLLATSACGTATDKDPATSLTIENDIDNKTFDIVYEPPTLIHNQTTGPILSIADRTARDIDYQPGKVKVTCTYHETSSNPAIPDVLNAKSYSQYHSLLSEKRYWLVYYQPVVSQYGGRLAVFIDADSHEVIAYILEQ